MVHVLGLDIPSRRLSDNYGLLEMQAPLVAPLVANRVNAPAVNARGYGENMNLRGGVFEHYPEGGGFMSESDDSENDAISIFSGISTATGGGESDHSDQSEGAQSDLSVPASVGPVRQQEVI